MPVYRFVGRAALERRALDALEDALTDAAEFLAGEAQNAAPVDSGDLKASIEAGPAERSPDGVEVKVTTGPEVDDYAVVQEVGYWVNFRGRYGFVPVIGRSETGGPGYMGDTLEAFGPHLEEYVRAKVGAAF